MRNKTNRARVLVHQTRFLKPMGWAVKLPNDCLVTEVAVLLRELKRPLLVALIETDDSVSIRSLDGCVPPTLEEVERILAAEVAFPLPALTLARSDR